MTTNKHRLYSVPRRKADIALGRVVEHDLNARVFLAFASRTVEPIARRVRESVAEAEALEG
jgi:hypothetical protein